MTTPTPEALRLRIYRRLSDKIATPSLPIEDYFGYLDARSIVAKPAEFAAALAVAEMLSGLQFDDTIPPAMWAALTDPAYVASQIAEDERDRETWYGKTEVR